MKTTATKVTPKLRRASVYAAADGRCGEVALRNLGASDAAVTRALSEVTDGTYQGRGIRLADLAVAAWDLFGRKPEFEAGSKVEGKTASDFAKRDGLWLVFVKGHVMAAGEGRVLNKCGCGQAQVLAAARVD